MTFNSYRELVCWQLAVQLRDEMIEITDRTIVARNRRFCDQVGDSTRSAVASIAEGFGRSNKEFRRYLEIALGSLRKSANHIDEALKRRYLSATEHQHFRGLTKGAHQAALGLAHYLEQRIRAASSQRIRKSGDSRNTGGARNSSRSRNPVNAGNADNPGNAGNPGNPGNVSNLADRGRHRRG